MQENQFLDDIDEEVDKVKSYGDLESASKRYHKSLIKRNESQIAEEKRRKEIFPPFL